MRNSSSFLYKVRSKSRWDITYYNDFPFCLAIFPLSYMGSKTICGGCNYTVSIPIPPRVHQFFFQAQLSLLTRHGLRKTFGYFHILDLYLPQLRLTPDAFKIRHVKLSNESRPIITQLRQS